MLLFQSSPNLSAGCSATPVAESLEPVPVSILTRPLGRVQLGYVLNLSLVISFNPHSTSRLGAASDGVLFGEPWSTFQSSPNLSVGCSNRGPRSGVPAGMFQSSPNLSVECSLHVGHIQVQVADVSILTQSLGWVQSM